MVFKPLADWKVRLLSIGMIEERYEQLLGGCLVVGWKSDWTTRPTWHCVLYWDWTRSIMTNWSCHCSTLSRHHCTIWWCVMCSNCYCIGPSLSPGIYQVSITLFSSHDPYPLCFIILSHTLCHMPLSLLITRPILFPWQCFPFVSACEDYTWYPRPHTLFSFLFLCNNTPWPEHIVKLSIVALNYLCSSSQVKDTWYWSIVNIPLKVHGQPVIIHELGLGSHKGDHDSTQGPLLLEDDNKRLRLPTTREEVSKPLDPYTLLMFTPYTNYAFLYKLVKTKEHWLSYSDTKGSSIPGGSWYGGRYSGAGSVVAQLTSASIISCSSFRACSSSSAMKSLTDPSKSGTTSSSSSVRLMTIQGWGVGLLSAKSIGSSIGTNHPSYSTNIWTCSRRGLAQWWLIQLLTNWWLMSGNWTCHNYVFLWAVIFLCFFAFSLYVSFTNLFSIILFLICWSPKTLKTKEKQDSILLVQGTV